MARKTADPIHPLLTPKALGLVGLAAIALAGIGFMIGSASAFWGGAIAAILASAGIAWISWSDYQKAFVRVFHENGWPSKTEVFELVLPTVIMVTIGILILPEVPPLGDWFSVPSPPIQVPHAPPAPAKSDEETGKTVLIDPLLATQHNPDGSDRVFVKVSPADIVKDFEGRTTDQASALVSRYIGKWMAFTGFIWDIYPDRSGNIEVDLGGADPLAAVMSGVFVQTHFDARWRDALSVFNKGGKISAVCQIADIQQVGMALGRCELINVP